MKNYKMKFVKSAAALALGASVITSAVVAGDLSASAKTTYKVSNGKLVNAKTKKAIKGYKVYKSVLYKDGKKFTGLYSKRYYKAGVKATGTYKGAYYVKGVKKVTTGTYAGAYYVKGVKKVATGTYNKTYYVKGKKVVATGLYKEKFYNAGVLNVGLALFQDKLYKDAELNKGLEKYENKYYFDADLANGTYEDNGVEKAFENGVEVGAKVKSVEVINGTTVEVKFNKAVDKEDAEKATIKLGTDSLTTGTLSEDGRTLTLTSTTAIVAEDSTVEVPAIATKADKTVKTAKYVTILNYKDTVAPELVSATASAKESTKDIVVTFNETLKNTNVIAYVNGVASQAVVEGKTVKVSSTSALKAGETATVKLVNLQDVAGNYTASNPVETTVTVVADTVAPTVVSTKVVGEDTVQVTFDKEVKTDDTKNAYLSANGVEVSKFKAGVVDVKDKKVVNYQLNDLSAFKDDKLSGTFYLPTGAVTDKAGNISAESNTVVSFAIDKVKPVISSVEFTKDNEIVVKFSKEISEADESKVTFQNPVTGATVEVNDLAAKVSTDDATKAIISGDFVDGTYDLTLASGFATDKASSKNVSDTNKSTLVVKKSAVAPTDDKTAPVATLASDINFTNNALTFSVEDTESALDFSSIRNVNNYTIDGKALPTGTVITTDAKDEKAKSATVTITVPAGTITKTITGKFAVSGIKDLAGNTISGLVTSDKDVTLKDDVAPTISSAKVYSDDTIVISFSEAVKADGKDILVSLDGATATAPTFTVGVGENAGKLVATVTGAYDASKVEVSYNKEATKTADNEGNELQEFKTFAATK